MQTDVTAEMRSVFNVAYKIGVALGRKFEASDLTPELRQAARMYAASYEGDFDYMVGMRDQVISGGGAFLSDRQSTGTLNCLMADARRRLAAKRAAPKIDPETGVEETADELLALVQKENAYDVADRDNRASFAHMQAVRASGRKLTYADVFPEDSVI